MENTESLNQRMLDHICTTSNQEQRECLLRKLFNGELQIQQTLTALNQLAAWTDAQHFALLKNRKSYQLVATAALVLCGSSAPGRLREYLELNEDEVEFALFVDANRSAFCTCGRGPLLARLPLYQKVEWFYENAAVALLYQAATDGTTTVEFEDLLRTEFECILEPGDFDE